MAEVNSIPDFKLPSLSLVQWLYVVVGLIILLPLAHSFYLSDLYVKELRNQDLAALGRRLNGTLQNVDERVQHIQSILETLAQSEYALDGDWRSLYDYARRVVRNEKTLKAITLVDADARIVFGTVVPFGSEHPLAAWPEDVKRVIETGKPSLSSPFMTPFNGIAKRSWLVAVSIPVSRHGKVTHVLRGIVSCESLRDLLLSDFNLPEGWLAAITDRRGVFIARTISHEETVGNSAIRPMAEAIQGRRSGRFSIGSLEGRPYTAQVGFLPSGDWSVQVGVSPQLVTARSQVAQRQASVLYVVIVASVMLLGWIAIHRLGRNIRSMIITAHAAAQDRPIETLPTGIRELDQLQEEFSRLAQTQRQLLDESHTQAEQLVRISDSLQEAQKIAHLGSFEYIVADGTTTWSEEQYRIHGLDAGGPAPTFGEFLARWIFPEDAEKIRQELISSANGQQEFDREHRLIWPDGSVRWVHTRAHRYADEQGRLLRYVGTTLDITEQRQAEEQARHNLDEISRLHRLHTANELASVLAHEINQPLAAIALYATACRQMLSKSEADRELLADSLERINQQSLRAGDIIRQMRRFIARGSIDSESLDLNAVIRGAGEVMESTASRNGIRLTFDLDPDMPPVMGVVVHIEQVLLNLLRNALDAIGEAGPEAGEVTVRTRLAGDQCRVTVSDSGPGITPEQAAELFDGVASYKPNGLGLGLRISRNLVEAHGGCLWVEPHVPGAIFHFELPLASSTQNSTALPGKTSLSMPS